MSLRKLIVVASLVLVALAATPSRASADWLFTPFIGGTFGGSADVVGGGENFSSDFNQKFSYGASLEWMGGGVFGFGVDFGYSPNFFGTDQFSLVGDGNVTTLMGNVIIGAPIGAIRPYASGGIGIMKSRVDNVGQFFDTIDKTNLGMDVGGGIMGFVSRNVGVRGDIRYFRQLQNSDVSAVGLGLGSFRYWRGSVGLTLRF